MQSHVKRFFSIIALLVPTTVVSPSKVRAQPQSASEFLDGVLQSVQESTRADGQRLTRQGASIAVDLVGLDTALTSLSLQGSYDIADLRGKHSSLRIESYRTVATCRAESFGERCEFPVGVQMVRFFEPRRISRDSVSFLIGVYERHPSDSRSYPGTGGAVFDVVSTRGSNGWRITSAKVRATG